MIDRWTRRCGALGTTDNSVHFRLWAPRAETVELVLIDEAGRRTRRMARGERGHFHHTEPHIVDGQRYAYRLDGGPERPDPASLWQPDGVHAVSAVVRPERFRWSDQRWAGVPQEDLVFYELHVGTFTTAGTFDAVIPRLESLRRLGVTAIEIMPVAQFPGARNWGYDGVLPYAVQNSYGGPQGLQRLIDASHAAGLAVFLDVVYNHVGPEGNYLNEFGPYFTDRYKTPWGPALNYDDAGSDAVRDYVLDNARMWIEEYHLDGLRLDAVHAIYDFSARHILRSIKQAVDEAARRRGRPALIVAESDLNDPRLLLPGERGGHGLDAQWSDDFHHTVHALLTGERHGYYEDFGQQQQLARVLEQPFLYAGDYSKHRDRKHGAPVGDLHGSRFVVSIQNHDQVGNRACGDRLAGLVAPPAQRLGASLLLLSPHLPLLFMGEEYGEDRPFLFFCSFDDVQLVENVRRGRRQEFAAFSWQGEVPDPQSESTCAASRLSWSWPEGTVHAGLRHLYEDLLAARRQWPALKDSKRRTAHLLPAEGAAILKMVRGEELDIYCNLTDQAQVWPAEFASARQLLFSSEAARYRGIRKEGENVRELLPHECVVFGPRGWPRFG